MANAALHDIRRELQHLDKTELMQLCLRLAKHKNENKELLSYLLFESDTPQLLIDKSKQELKNNFAELNTQHVYYIKKGLRKMMRTISRYAKFAQSKQVEAQLWTDFCLELKNSKLTKRHGELQAMMDKSTSKIEKLLVAMHEDLRSDFYQQLEELSN